MAPRWHNFPDDYRLTQEQCAMFAGCAVSTIAHHRLAGLLPYIPSRPIRIRVGDFRVYMRMMTNGVKTRLHRSLHIDSEDAAVYSRLDGVVSFMNEKPDVVIENVVNLTESLWKKYKAQAKAKAKREARKAA